MSQNNTTEILEELFANIGKSKTDFSLTSIIDGKPMKWHKYSEAKKDNHMISKINMRTSLNNEIILDCDSGDYEDDNGQRVEGYFEILEANSSFVKFATKENVIMIPFSKVIKIKEKRSEKAE